MSQKKKKGRPTESSFHLNFMKLIKKKKHVAITEANFIISLNKFITTHQKDLNHLKKLKKNQFIELQSTEKDLEQLSIGSLSKQEKKKIIQRYQQIKSSSDFNQIFAQQQDLIFGDHFDLSRIFYEMADCQVVQFDTFSFQKLFFISLLSIWQAKLLCKTTLETIMESKDFILEALKYGFQKIHEELKQNLTLNMEDQQMQFSNEQQQISINESLENFQKEEQKKTIKKKKTKQLTSKEIKQIKKEFYVNLCSYICHSYFYIIKKDLSSPEEKNFSQQKLREMKKQQKIQPKFERTLRRRSI